MNLALCDILFAVFAAPLYFIPFLGYRYHQGYGSDTMCTVQTIFAFLTILNDWLILAYITMTRAIHLKWPKQWKAFCSNKIYLFLLLLSPWLVIVLILLPPFIQVQISIYNSIISVSYTHLTLPTNREV